MNHLCLSVQEAKVKCELDIVLDPLSHHKFMNPHAQGWEGARCKAGSALASPQAQGF